MKLAGLALQKMRNFVNPNKNAKKAGNNKTYPASTSNKYETLSIIRLNKEETMPNTSKELENIKGKWQIKIIKKQYVKKITSTLYLENNKSFIIF